MIKLGKILCPTDFSDLSLAAIKYGRSFAEQYDAKLHCLHVVDEAYQYWLTLGPEGIPLGPTTEQVQETSKKQMAKFVSEHLADYPKLVTKILSGRPFVEIIRYARQQEIDMIVLATHGRTGISHVLMGSVAERVVRKAPCPVLIVRSSGHDFVMP